MPSLECTCMRETLWDFGAVASHSMGSKQCWLWWLEIYRISSTQGFFHPVQYVWHLQPCPVGDIKHLHITGSCSQVIVPNSCASTVCYLTGAFHPREAMWWFKLQVKVADWSASFLVLWYYIVLGLPWQLPNLQQNLSFVYEVWHISHSWSWHCCTRACHRFVAKHWILSWIMFTQRLFCHSVICDPWPCTVWCVTLVRYF